MDQDIRRSEATGEIGEVYTTPTGNNLADIEVHNVGWLQTDATHRVEVRPTTVAKDGLSIWMSTP